MKVRTFLTSLAILFLGTSVAFAAGRFSVTPREYDPMHTFLVQAAWLDGIGCPSLSAYKDPACNPNNDSSDNRNQGLLLAKTGPTTTNASAFADIRGVTGPITELGYDLRKPVNAVAANGSHCGAGAPRFNVETTHAFYFIGCNSPPAVQTQAGLGWIRLRWGGSTPLLGFNAASGALEAVTGDVKRISIVFDEGQDTGPDFFGLAVLDNIDVNATLVGRGENTENNKGKNKDKGDDGDNNDQGEND